MSTTNTTTAAPARASAASSSKVRTFVVTVAIVGVLVYCICLFFNLPAFTYHPAVNRVELWWGPARSGEGPAMYWYGWAATTLIVSTIVGFLATLLPERVTRRIPLYLVWILPVL